MQNDTLDLTKEKFSTEDEFCELISDFWEKNGKVPESVYVDRKQMATLLKILDNTAKPPKESPKESAHDEGETYETTVYLKTSFGLK